MQPKQNKGVRRITPTREREIISLIISNAEVFEKTIKAGLPITYAKGRQIIRQTNDQVEIVGELLSEQVEVKHRRYSV